MPRQILDFASRLLPSIAPGLRPAVSLRADPGALRVEPVPPGPARPRGWRRDCAAALGRPGSVAVICADAQLAETAAALRAAGPGFAVLGAEARARAVRARGRRRRARLTLVPVTLAKGLEFDHVVLGRARPDRDG